MLDKRVLYDNIKLALDTVRAAAEMSKGKYSQETLDDLFAKGLADSILKFIQSGDVNTSVTGVSPSGAVTGTGVGKIV